MADFLAIAVTGHAELVESLRRAAQRLDNPGELLQAIGDELKAAIELRFEAKRDPTGAPWERLADSTRERYAAEDQGARRGTLLERTGQMRNSLTVNAGDDWVEVGMSRLTARGGAWSIPLLHETGTTRMPRRGIFLADWESGTLGREDAAALDAVLGEFLDDVFGA